MGPRILDDHKMVWGGVKFKIYLFIYLFIY